MKRILLVEGHNVLREVLASELDRVLGLEVAAQTGSLTEARSAARLGGIDLAVIDPDLPDGDGLELVRELRDVQPHSIPTLVLTTSPDPAVHELALQAGASEVLATGVSIEELVLLTLRRI